MTNPNVPAEVRSACQWMLGNTFIGPDQSYRIDDLGESFDYGAYRDLRVHGENSYNFKKNNKNVNEKEIPSLENLYISMKTLIALDQNNSLNNTHYPIINNLLIQLTKLSKQETTVHKERPNPRKPAYNAIDWLSIGKTKVAGLDGTKRIPFITMYKKYIEIRQDIVNSRGQSTVNEIQFHDFCRKYILTESNRQKTTLDDKCVIARHTYNLIEEQYIRLIGPINQETGPSTYGEREKGFGGHKHKDYIKGKNVPKRKYALSKYINEQIDYMNKDMDEDAMEEDMEEDV